ncbi:synaptonemal complex protein 3-like [Cricetulus griseus]|uniref:Synaptonemal complex protein 3-like n=1 Tax=Cricetulus griseus TaxID=10029 RepID=A0A9J7GNG2_CRIGR|nr:synaptonemal complex protein 3-like isoform X2 [Cricetulus griseus]XP_027289238.1 synaptonemal complex protein 3-like [Cricetulus griseus]
MPPKGKKATSKTSKRPQDSPDSDDELKRSVPKKPETPGLEISEEDSASSDQDEQQARESVQKMLQELQGELTKSYLAKRKQFRKGVKTSMNVLNRKLLYIYKTQQKERRMLHSKYSQMFVPLFQQWEKDVMKVEQEEESFVNAYEQHVESLKKSAMAQKATIDEAKKISDQFLQSVKDLEDNHLRLDAVEQCTMEEEMENLKMKLTTENQHQNVMAMETCLFSLLSEDYEEKL